MTVEEVRVAILRRAQARHPEEAHVRPFVLANDSGLAERHLRELLVGLHQERLIRLERWHDTLQSAVPYDQWPGAQFFQATTDGGYVRITLLARGQELLDGIRTAPVGFRA